MRPFLAIAILAAPLAATACANTYHPEYHPVSITRLQQDLAYPVTVQNGPSPGPVVIVPAMPPLPGQPLLPWPTE
jgi:hypothetical protein